MHAATLQTRLVESPEPLALCAALAGRLPTAADGAEVASLLAQTASALGADAAAFASFMKDDETYESYRFILACDAAWCLEYESGACFMHDPWWDYARHHSTPTLAGDIPARTQREEQVVALAHRYGFQSAVIVPAQSPQGLTRLGVLCLGSAQPDYFDGDGLSVISFAALPVAMRLHEWQIGQLRDDMLESARLSDADLDLLRFQRQGLGSKAVAAALKIKPMSVDSRWQRLNARLGVNSRAAAANIAAEYGLI